MRKIGTVSLIAIVTLLLFSVMAATPHSQASGSEAGQALPATCNPGWNVVYSPGPGASYNDLSSVSAIAANDVWAVGSYNNGGSTVEQTLTEHWDGSSWSVVASPNVGTGYNYLSSVSAIAANDVWAVGYYENVGRTIDQTLTEHWDGSSWSVVASPNVGTSYNVLSGVSAISANDVWAAGGYHTVSGIELTLTEHWDGSSWIIVYSPNVGTSHNYLSGVTAISVNDVWAVGGYFNSGSTVDQTLTEHWDGSSWSVVSSPNVGTSNNVLSGVSAIAANDVWAVGRYDNVGSTAEQTLTEHWDGSSWSVVSSPNVGTGNNVLSGVSAIVANDVWAVGYYFNSGSFADQTLTEHWDGSSWSVVSNPNVGTGYNNLLSVSAISASNVWAAGSYFDGGAYQPLTEHYSAPGCATPTSASPTNTPGSPTNTPGGPTNTPAPTNTPGGPTNTPAPTNTFAPTATPQPTICANPFVDINSNIFFHAINYLYCSHAVNGTDATHYSPAGTSTRGQFAKVVVLGFGLPLYTPSGGQDFNDVPPTYFAYTYIESGYHASILNGFDANTCAVHGVAYPCYLPNVPITRGQITKLVVSAANYALITPAGGTPTFSDVPASNVFFVSIETAHNKGVINGYPDHTFRPNNNIRRDEMAQIVYKGVTTP